MDGGRTCAGTAAIVGFSLTWVRTLIRRSNADGATGVGDHRHANPGGTPLLTSDQQGELRAALGTPPPVDGLWTTQTVADWIEALRGRPIAEQRGWDLLRRQDFSPPAPDLASGWLPTGRPRQEAEQSQPGQRLSRHRWMVAWTLA